MPLLIEQLKKLTTFFIILLLLFLVNIFVNLNYQWDGISIIVRVYIFLLSFYMISNIASVDVESLKKDFREEKGSFGIFYLFFQVRLAPVIIIYMITFIYGVIDYIGHPGGVVESLAYLLGGGKANTVIYSVMLLMILEMRRDPQVTIPLFLAVSVFYLLVLDKLVYIYFDHGIVVSLIKIAKYAIFFFFIYYEFFYKKKRIPLFAFSGLASGLVIHGIVTGLLFMIVSSTPGSSRAYYHASSRLLVSGFTSHFKEMERNLVENNYYNGVPLLLKYSGSYGFPIGYSVEEWQKLITGSSASRVNKITGYLRDKKIEIDFAFLVRYMVLNIKKSRGQIGESENITAYIAERLQKNRNVFYWTIEKEDRLVKIWGMKVAGKARDLESMPYLIEKLSSFDAEDSVNAYDALKKIAGIDPAQPENLHANSPAVIARFREFYLNSRKASQ